MSTSLQWVTAAIVLVTSGAVGRVPGLRMNRATIALVGAASLVAIGALDEHAATICLLFTPLVVEVAQRLKRDADQRGVKLTFFAYLRAGVPITLLGLLVGVLWLG